MSGRLSDNFDGKFWIQTVITLCTMLTCIGVAWGSYTSKISILEEKINRVQTDHDLLISVNAKLDIMLQDVGELKGDVKKHLIERK